MINDEGEKVWFSQTLNLFADVGPDGLPIITPDHVASSLLRANYFPALNGRNPELPEIFNSRSFTPFAARKLTSIPSQRTAGFDYVKYVQTKYDGHARHTALPHPHAYGKLVLCIAENWDNLGHLVYGKESQIRPLLLRDGRLFDLNYPNSDWGSVDDEAARFEVSDSKFIARFDIQSCFSSIYTHTLGWIHDGTLDAKRRAKARHSNNHFSDRLDWLAQQTNRGQTNGLLVGPGTSNLLAEYILQKIDSKLRAEFGSRHVRWIDDFEFYANSESEARKFGQILEQELFEYNWQLNPHKTSLISRGEAKSAWPLNFQKRVDEFQFSTKAASSIWEHATQVSHSEVDQRILRYTTSTILDGALSAGDKDFASTFLVDKLGDYPYLTPYLSRFINDGSSTLNSHEVGKLANILKNQFDVLRSDARTWLLAAVGLGRQIDESLAERILGIPDFVPWTLLYEFRQSDTRQIIEKTSELSDPLYFDDKWWLLKYQMSLGGEIKDRSDQHVESLMESGVDFIDRNYIVPF